MYDGSIRGQVGNGVRDFNEEGLSGAIGLAISRIREDDRGDARISTALPFL
jgi:hypothetical protein